MNHSYRVRLQGRENEFFNQVSQKTGLMVYNTKSIIKNQQYKSANITQNEVKHDNDFYFLSHRRS